MFLDCSGNGRCRGLTGECECEAEYTGADCSIPVTDPSPPTGTVPVMKLTVGFAIPLSEWSDTMAEGVRRAIAVSMGLSDISKVRILTVSASTGRRLLTGIAVEIAIYLGSDDEGSEQPPAPTLSVEALQSELTRLALPSATVIEHPIIVYDPAPMCGDGKRFEGEVCDDGNIVGGDGCSSSCTIESGYTCVGGSLTAPDACSTTCEDGFKAGLEMCDWTLQDLAISQSSNIPCSKNTITIEFKPSTSLLTDCEPKVTVRGLKGISSETISEISAESGGSRLQGAITVLSWNRDMGQLELAFNTPVFASTYKISMNVTNQKCKRPAEMATLSVSTSR